MSETNSVFSDFLDGAQGSIGLKSDVVLNNFTKRLGANLPGFAAGIFTQGALTRKGLRKLDPAKANAVVDATPGGSLTVRKF